MRKLLFYSIFLFSLFLGPWSCETPESTLNEASQDIQKGITGQGKLEERGWDDVEVYQN